MTKKKNNIHIVGTGTIGLPLIGLFTRHKKSFDIDEVTFHKNTPLLLDKSKVVNLLKRGARLSTNEEKFEGFRDIGLKPEFSTNDAINRASVVIDCTPSGYGHKNKNQYYEKYMEMTEFDMIKS